ncbi:protein phosphatase 1 regulatory subunit 15A [Python bivittatus]|uniref:Protein phosphatase 1 regulatory subunit 15A n=1 Tax=Python bivittatus TaxID=176946 RepID=A0A9F2RAM6_PYTBI|nr:protein phosphatase 1 regulatory subunit 15A [Python bivittatus]
MLERVYYWLKIQSFKMPPCIMSSQFTSHFEARNIFLNSCYPFGSGMARILPPEPVSSTPAGKFTVLGHMAQITMVWLRRFLYFWQHFPANLVKIVLMGIARRAVPVLEKMKLKKAGELKRNENDTEKKIGKGSCLENHSLKSHKNYLSEESLVMEGYFGEGIEQPLINSSNITMNNMYLEKDGISELCLISPTIILDLGNNWENSSGKDIECVIIKSPGHVPPKLLDDTYHPEIFTKGLDFCEYFEKTLDCFNRNGKLNFDKGLGQILETTVVPQELEKNMKSNQNPVTCGEQSLTCSLDSSKDEEQPEMNRKSRENEDTYSMESPTIPSTFQSPLVLSLFYSPLEEEEDNNDDNSEDWWSEDEMEESGQDKTYSDGNNSGEIEDCLEVEDDSVHQVVFENLCGALSMDNDHFHPLCFSKPIRALEDHTTASLKPKNLQETVVSSYLTRTNSKLEELCHLPKQSWPREDQKVASNQETHRCYQPSPRKNTSPIPAEIPLVLQQEIQVKKKVRFSPVVTIHPLVVWDYASRAARRGPWEEMARDRCRFHRRIAQVAAILEPCLAVDHRDKVWKKIHEVPVSLLEEAADSVPFCSSSTRKEELGL